MSLRTRFLFVLMSVGTVLLTAAPTALASAANGGEGWYGETTDPVITSTMFIVIAFFPTVIIIFTLIQSRLDKRKHARQDAAKARETNEDWRGGW